MAEKIAERVGRRPPDSLGQIARGKPNDFFLNVTENHHARATVLWVGTPVTQEAASSSADAPPSLRPKPVSAVKESLSGGTSAMPT